jgi:hypothetical protein
MMNRQQQVEWLTWAFKEASRYFRNPADCGHTPRSYGVFVAGQIRQELSKDPLPRPTIIPRADALAIADGLERGDFDSELAGLMGLV